MNTSTGGNTYVMSKISEIIFLDANQPNNEQAHLEQLRNHFHLEKASLELGLEVASVMPEFIPESSVVPSWTTTSSQLRANAYAAR